MTSSRLSTATGAAFPFRRSGPEAWPSWLNRATLVAARTELHPRRMHSTSPSRAGGSGAIREERLSSRSPARSGAGSPTSPRAIGAALAKLAICGTVPARRSRAWVAWPWPWRRPSCGLLGRFARPRCAAVRATAAAGRGVTVRGAVGPTGRGQPGAPGRRRANPHSGGRRGEAAAYRAAFGCKAAGMLATHRTRAGGGSRSGAARIASYPLALPAQILALDDGLLVVERREQRRILRMDAPPLVLLDRDDACPRPRVSPRYGAVLFSSSRPDHVLYVGRSVAGLAAETAIAATPVVRPPCRPGACRPRRS